MATVELKALQKIYGASGKNAAFEAVKQIDLQIREGEFMVLVGPSGCGKSTTLRMIAGLEDVTSGAVLIGGRVVNDVAPKNRDIAMVFQNYALYPHMSVYDNMAFGLKLQKKPKREIRQRVEDAAEILGISELLERKPKALSGGQRQRVAVGRAIVRKPKVFLFDEPLSNLDAKMRVSMRAELSRLHARLKVTMVYVTHDQVEAMTMGDRICVMKDGEIMQIAEPLELYNHPRNLFVAGFIGSPPMNFFSGELCRKDGRISFLEANETEFRLNLMLPERFHAIAEGFVGRKIVFGIRPEDIADASKMPGDSRFETGAAEVDVSEPMGAETYLYLHTGAHHFVAKVPSEGRYEIGQKVGLRFDMEKCHLFDPESENVLQERP